MTGEVLAPNAELTTVWHLAREAEDGQAEPRRQGAMPMPKRLRLIDMSGRTWWLWRRWLAFDAGERWVQTGPAWRAAGPDVGHWLDGRWIVERSEADNRKANPSSRICEKMTSAPCAEASADSVAAVAFAAVLRGAAFNLDALAREDRVDRTVSSDVLTVATPADPRDDRFCSDSEAKVATEATACSFGHRGQPSFRAED